MSLIKKIWGTRQRLLVTHQAEIDLLFLDANTACSIHNHESKVNRFILLSGAVEVKTDLGTKKLVINEPFDVEPPTIHQFIIRKNSVMIELAFVSESGWIEANDINRIVQGGRIINKKFITLDELREKGKLEL